MYLHILCLATRSPSTQVPSILTSPRQWMCPFQCCLRLLTYDRLNFILVEYCRSSYSTASSSRQMQELVDEPCIKQPFVNLEMRYCHIRIINFKLGLQLQPQRCPPFCRPFTNRHRCKRAPFTRLSSRLDFIMSTRHRKVRSWPTPTGLDQ